MSICKSSSLSGRVIVMFKVFRIGGQERILLPVRNVLWRVKYPELQYILSALMSVDFGLTLANDNDSCYWQRKTDKIDWILMWASLK